MYSAEDLFTEDAEDDLERIVEGNHDDQASVVRDDGNEANDGNENDQGGDDNDDGNQAADGTQAAVKPKRVVRNPQPKFNADTLRNPRGLLCLESLFDRVQFKGRGHEEQDLNVLMKTYEYWCHRMFPKFPFDDSIARLEKLGTKKPVQAYMKRIRLDMLTDSDERPELVVDQPEDEADHDDDDRFDSLLPQTESNPQRMEAEPWTDEQLSRLEENRKKAEKIKLEKLRKIQEKATSVLERSQNNHTVNHASSSADRRNEFPDEFDEIDDRVNTQNDFPMEEDASESAQEPREALQWSHEQLQRLEENRKRAEKIRLERQRKTQAISSETKQDTEITNPRAYEDATSANLKKNYEANDDIATNSEECTIQTSSSSFAQEHDSKPKSLIAEDNLTATGSNSSQDCSQEMFNEGNTDTIAQGNVDLHRVSDEMEVDEITLSNNKETLPVNLVDPNSTTCDVEDGLAINVSQSENTQIDGSHCKQ